MLVSDAMTAIHCRPAVFDKPASLNPMEDQMSAQLTESVAALDISRGGLVLLVVAGISFLAGTAVGFGAFLLL
jgi:hypothetical protein